MQQKLEELKESGESTWDDLKQGVEKAIDGLKTSVKEPDFQNQLNRGPGYLPYQGLLCGGKRAEDGSKDQTEFR